MAEMVEGRAVSSQIASFLTASKVKGFAPQEIVGATRALRDRAPRVCVRNEALAMDREEIHLDDETIDRTSFRNGRGTKTFNISTATAFVTAAAGVGVVRCGGVTSSEFVGSEHVLRALGLELEITRTVVERCLDEVGLAFIYMPLLQAGWGPTLDVRRQLGFRTLLNVVAPLCNPCGAKNVFLGVYEPEDVVKMAKILRSLDIENGLVVHGDDCLDEASITGKTIFCQLRPAGFDFQEMSPEDVGLPRAAPEEIRGGNARDNAQILRAVLEGDRGARRNVVLLNAALSLMGAGKADSIRIGLEMAAEAIDSGDAKGRLDTILKITNERGYTRRT